VDDGSDAANFTGFKDDRHWRIGTQGDVSWIADHTYIRLGITSAIPAGFDGYATIVNKEGDEQPPSEAALVRQLEAHSADSTWWLGYLDTGAHDVVFPNAPMVRLYGDWRYVLVEAGPEQAATWREGDAWRGRLPDLIFPADRSWLVSMLWDDDWRCIGGPASLIQAVLADPALDAREVTVDQEDATPPGFEAR